jgi:hypothetical protein
MPVVVKAAMLMRAKEVGLLVKGSSMVMKADLLSLWYEMISAYNRVVLDELPSVVLAVVPPVLYRPTKDMRGKPDKAAIWVFMCVRAAASVGAAARAAGVTKFAKGSVVQLEGDVAPEASLDLSMRMPLSGFPSLSTLCKKRAMYTASGLSGEEAPTKSIGVIKLAPATDGRAIPPT